MKVDLLTTILKCTLSPYQGRILVGYNAVTWNARLNKNYSLQKNLKKKQKYQNIILVLSVLLWSYFCIRKWTRSLYFTLPNLVPRNFCKCGKVTLFLNRMISVPVQKAVGLFWKANIKRKNYSLLSTFSSLNYRLETNIRYFWEG